MNELLELTCPYCGEDVELVIDVAGGSSQSYVEDCPVCCRPWVVRAVEEEPGGYAVGVARQDA